jgi:hypothetical protein
MIKSKAIRNSAKGEECTLNIGGVCENNSETTVLCHFSLHDGGSARLNGDLSAGYGCFLCHEIIDLRRNLALSQEEREFYMRRSMVRTLDRLVEKGLVIIK